jgi:transposase
LIDSEYLEQHPDGYRYTQFCEIYRRWLRRRGLSMRQLHRAGEKCFVDYAGQKPKIIDPATGEMLELSPGCRSRRQFHGLPSDHLRYTLTSPPMATGREAGHRPHA